MFWAVLTIFFLSSILYNSLSFILRAIVWRAYSGSCSDSSFWYCSWIETKESLIL